MRTPVVITLGVAAARFAVDRLVVPVTPVELTELYDRFADLNTSCGPERC
jgi:hypothetical protein